MKTLDYNFRGQMEGEKVITFSRKHWVALLPDILPFALFVGIIITMFLEFSEIKIANASEPLFQLLVIMSLVAVGVVIHRFFLHIIKFFLSVTIFTNYRIVEMKKTLFLHDIKESLYYNEIQDVEYEQNGFFKNILKLGTICITLGGGNDSKKLTQIPNPDFHFRLVSKLKSDYFVSISKDQRENDRQHQSNIVSTMASAQRGSESGTKTVKTNMGDYVL